MSLAIVSFVPATENPAGNRKLAIWQIGDFVDLSAAMASLQHFSSVGRSRPATEHMLCGVRSVAFCMASPRNLTSFRQSAKSRMPAAQMAVYSPRLKPATAWTRSTSSPLPVAFMTSSAAMPAMNMQGWQNFVSASCASGPLSMSSLGSQPRIPLASSSIALTAGRLTQSFIMPTYCEPCPGNTSATGSGGFDFGGNFSTVAAGMSILAAASAAVGIGYGIQIPPVL
mmetsp:Transcript_7238/g.13404  ORF Transcript_7238/g.13404 Transcript_7238/m.13404 type:complete len:227 (+) Transcript_7238:631-1311(+)